MGHSLGRRCDWSHCSKNGLAVDARGRPRCDLCSQFGVSTSLAFQHIQRSYED